MIKTIQVKSSTRTEMIDVTSQVTGELAGTDMQEGILTLYVPHTTAAITINEGADPAVKADILMVLNKMVPWEAPYKHMEGNSPAHVKATLVGASETVLVKGGRLLLGTWQKIFFCEFDGPRNRRLIVQFQAI
ncbi:MAG: YjbQ family protein [Deltaproteobacteria bacterium]|nr:YjbQ family protein [Deltaproteobacteria bacterium]MBW2071031.1 YjbQ family protein [Deltaproteobacteria bacterium]